MPTSRGDSPSDAIDGANEEEEEKAESEGGAKAQVVALEQQVNALEQRVLEVHFES